MKRGLNALWIAASAGLVSPALAQDLPGFDKVSDGFEAVVSTADGARPIDEDQGLRPADGPAQLRDAAEAFIAKSARRR